MSDALSAIPGIRGQPFRFLADATPALVWMSGSDGGCTGFNRAWLEFTGRALEQELGAGWLEGVHPDDAARCMRDYLAAFQARREFSLEYRLRRHDGVYRWILDHGAPRFSTDGEFEGYVGAATDVTALKTVELAIVDSSPEAIASASLDGTVLSWNRGAERMFGYTAAEMVGHSMAILCPPERADEVSLFLARIKRGEPVEAFQTVRVRKDGTRIHVSKTLSPIRDADGQITACAAVIHDVSDEVNAFAALKQEIADRSRELSALVDAARAVASTLDFERLLNLIVDHVKLIVDCECAYLFLRAGDSFVLVGCRGPDPEISDFQLQTALSSSHLREALVDTAEPFLVEDVIAPDEAAARFRRAFGSSGARGPGVTRSWIWIPLRIQDEVEGALCLGHATSRHFTPRHLPLIQAFAGQAAIALRNARLDGEARRLAAIQEHQRLAGDLHEAVSQTLFATSLIAEALPRLLDQRPEEGRRRLDDLKILIRAALAEMRALMLELKPDGLTAIPLDNLLLQLTESLVGRTGMKAFFDATDELPALPAEVHLALYRIAQEALNNVASHARASRVTVRLSGGPGEVELVVRDDGRGFDVDRVPAGRGLPGMRERASGVAATLAIESRIGGGTQIRVVCPLPAR